MKGMKWLLPLVLALLLSGCASSEAENPEAENPYLDEAPMEGLSLENEAMALSSAPAAVNDLLAPVASGTAVESAKNASIDYSNVADGYVMVRYGASNSKRMKVQVTGPTTTYTYDLPASVWTTFPLSDGNGSYKVTALQNTQGSKYATLASVSFKVQLKDEFAPFIRPNQYVD